MGDQKIRDDLYPRVVGMDGGLVCQYLMTNSEGNLIIVYNPFAKTLKELPTAPDHGTSQEFPDLHVIVDSISRNFKIFLINHSFHDSEFLADPNTSLEDHSKVLNDPSVRVYDSTTNEWQILANPSCIERGLNEVSSAMFQGFVYYLLSSTDQHRPLWRYNLSEDVWENAAEPILGELFCPQLMVRGNRLFLAAWWLEQVIFELSDIKRVCRFEVSEIKIADMAQETLFKMSNKKVIKAFDTIAASDIRPIIASTFGNSLHFISKFSRKSMVFDLETRPWGQWPNVHLGNISDDDYFLGWETHEPDSAQYTMVTRSTSG